MTDVRIVAWNIKDFKGSTFTKHGNRILDLLYDAAGTRRCDVFVIVEPFSKMKKFGVGEIVTTGAGLDGILALYYALKDRDQYWRVVPPRVACKPPKSDMVAVFYYSRVVTFDGPQNATPGAAVVTKTVNPNGHPDPWPGGLTPVGQIRYYDSLSGNEIDFKGRRPYLVQFGTPQRVTRSFQLTVRAAAGGPLAVITGSPLPPATANVPYELRLQANGGTPPYTWADRGTGNLPAGLTLHNDGTLDGQDAATGIFLLDARVTDNTGATADVSLQLTIRAAAGGVLQWVTPAALPDAVAGQVYTLRLQADGGTPALRFYPYLQLAADALPANLTLAAATGRWHFNVPAAAGAHTVDVDVVDSRAGTFQVLALHAPPDNRYPNNAAMVENLADIEEITINRGATPVAVCGDFNVCPIHPCTKNHQVRERQALNPLTLQGYASHNGNARTGCKSSAKAQKDAYAAIQATNALALDAVTTHAYDHVLTQGFGGGNVQNVATADVVQEDPGFAAALLQAQGGVPHPVKGIVRRWLWKHGVSDHLPVRYTLVI